MSLPAPVAYIPIRALSVIPAAVLAILVILLALLGLLLRKAGRDYAQEIIHLALRAACALMAGCPLDTSHQPDHSTRLGAPRAIDPHRGT